MIENNNVLLSLPDIPPGGRVTVTPNVIAIIINALREWQQQQKEVKRS